MPDNPTPQAQWSVRNVTNALVVALLSAGVLACQLYADTWPKPTAIVALALIVFASIMRLPISSVAPAPQVNIESAPNMTQNVAAPADAPPPRHPAPAHPPVRDARGQYAKAAPIDVVADH
jgi:hypothetical protein